MPELTDIEVGEDGVTFGAGVTLSALEKKCTALIDSMPASRVRILSELVNMLQWFAGET